MAVDRFALQAPKIRFVVAHDEIGLGFQGGHQGTGEPHVSVMKHPDMPGPRRAAPDGREGMQRHDRGRDAGAQGALDRRLNRVVVGIVEAAQAALDLVGAHPRVARDHSAVGKPHHQGRVVAASVRVDDEAREGGEHRRCAKKPGKRPGQVGRTDVVADMALELRAGQAELGKIRRDGIRGVVTEQDEPGGRGAFDRFDGMGFESRCDVEAKRGGGRGHGEAAIFRRG